MPRITVVPAKGRRVRDPETGQYLAPEGAEVEWGPYWIRRERDGDVTRERVAQPRRARRGAAEE